MSDPGAPPSGEPAEDDGSGLVALALLGRASEILTALRQQGWDPTDPEQVLALQLLGPVLARVIGDDPRRNVEAVVKIAEAVDLETVRKLLQ